MKHEQLTFVQKQADLDNLSISLRLLAAAGEAIQEANEMLQRAKRVASDINDPELRRKAMAAAGELKATTGHFFESQ